MVHNTFNVHVLNTQQPVFPVQTTAPLELQETSLSNMNRKKIIRSAKGKTKSDTKQIVQSQAAKVANEEIMTAAKAAFGTSSPSSSLSSFETKMQKIRERKRELIAAMRRERDSLKNMEGNMKSSLSPVTNTLVASSTSVTDAEQGLQRLKIIAMGKKAQELANVIDQAIVEVCAYVLFVEGFPCLF